MEYAKLLAIPININIPQIIHVLIVTPVAKHAMVLCSMSALLVQLEASIHMVNA